MLPGIDNSLHINPAFWRMGVFCQQTIHRRPAWHAPCVGGRGCPASACVGRTLLAAAGRGLSYGGHRHENGGRRRRPFDGRRGFAGSGQLQSEGRALARTAIDADPAVMRFDDVAAHREPQARAPFAAGVGAASWSCKTTRRSAAACRRECRSRCRGPPGRPCRFPRRARA